MASSSTARASLPAEGSLFWDYLEGQPLGAVLEMDLRADSDKLGDQDGDKERQRAPFSVKKVSDDEWRVLLDGKAEGELIPGHSSTKALFWLVRQQGQEFISVARGGTDPLEIKKEMVDQGRAAEQPAFISIREPIELNSDDEESLPLTELFKGEGKSIYEVVRPPPPPCPCMHMLRMHMRMHTNTNTHMHKHTHTHTHTHEHMHVHMHMHEHMHHCGLVLRVPLLRARACVLAGPTFAYSSGDSARARPKPGVCVTGIVTVTVTRPITPIALALAAAASASRITRGTRSTAATATAAAAAAAAAAARAGAAAAEEEAGTRQRSTGGVSTRAAVPRPRTKWSRVGKIWQAMLQKGPPGRVK